MYPTCGLKGQHAKSPGHRPRYSGQTTFALKGQKHYIWMSTKVMAYEARSPCHSLLSAYVLSAVNIPCEPRRERE